MRQINHQNKSTDKSGYYGKNTTIHFSRRYPFKIKIHIIYQRKNKPGKHANNTQYTRHSKSGNHNQFQNHQNNSGNEYQNLPTCRQSIQIQRCKIKYGSNQGGGRRKTDAGSLQLKINSSDNYHYQNRLQRRIEQKTDKIIIYRRFECLQRIFRHTKPFGHYFMNIIHDCFIISPF